MNKKHYILDVIKLHGETFKIETHCSFKDALEVAQRISLNKRVDYVTVFEKCEDSSITTVKAETRLDFRNGFIF